MDTMAAVQVRTNAVTNAANEHLKNYVVAIAPLDDETDHFGKGGGSGVAVQIGDRRFVATAAHVLSVPNERLTLLSLGRSTGWAEPGGVLRRGVIQDPMVDVAFLEIDDTLAARLACSFFPLDRIRPHAGSLSGGEKVMLHGFPGALRNLADAQGLSMRAGAQGFITMRVDTPPSQTPADRLHVYFDYPKIWRMARGESSAPSAEGYSGSGIWLINCLQDRLWGPSQCELISIQTHWNATERWVRGTEIHRWLNLVASSYSDLKPLIEKYLDGAP
jgi:hypothetical protein